MQTLVNNQLLLVGHREKIGTYITSLVETKIDDTYKRNLMILTCVFIVNHIGCLSVQDWYLFLIAVSKKKYLVTFKDVYSNYCLGHFLMEKSDVKIE